MIYRPQDIFLALTLCLAMADAKTIRLGLVAGHNRGYGEDANLRYAEADAQKMAELLHEVGGVEEENIILLKSPRPEELDRAFQDIRDMSAKVGPDDEVVFIFYYSGHGNGDNLKLGRKAFPLKELKARIDQVPAKLRIGILDACQSGAITRFKGARMVQPFVLEQQLKSQGSILITSSSENENSQESEQLKGSFFTHHLASALRGAGDVSGDRRVTLLEAYQYAFQRTLVHTEGTRGGAQHANAQFNMDVEGDVVLTDLNSGSGGLVFKTAVDGDILIANSRSQVVGEFHKEKGRDVFLALPAGTYRIFQRDGGKTRQLRTRLKDKEIRAVEAGDLKTGFRLAGIAKGGEGEEAVQLPWKVQDWPAQYPFEIALGRIPSGLYSSYIALTSYRFLPAVGVSASYTANTYRGGNPITGELHSQDLRLGLQAGKFLSPNLEFISTLFHRAVYNAESAQVFYGPCGDSTVGNYCETRMPVEPANWNFTEGTGVYFSARLWVLSRISVEFGYGTEYI